MSRWPVRTGWIAVISLASIASAAWADSIELTTGDVLRGTVIQQTDEMVVLQHPVLGRLEIPIASISAMQIDETAPTYVPAVPSPIGPPPPLAEQPPPVEPMPVMSPEVVPEHGPWQSRLELGANVREGQTEDANVRVAFITTHKTEQHVHTFDARYALASSRGDRSENKFTSGVKLDWPLPASRLDPFAEARYDYDEFNSWDQRITGGLGMGYQAVDVKKTVDEHTEDVLGIKLNLGVGVKREFGSDENNWQPEGILGTDIYWIISPRQRFAATATWFPSLVDWGGYRFVSTAEWVVKLDWMRGLSFKLGFADEYQSVTDPGIDHSSYSVFASLLVDF